MFGTKKELSALREDIHALKETILELTSITAEATERTSDLHKQLGTAQQSITILLRKHQEYEERVHDHTAQLEHIRDEFSRTLDMIKRDHGNFEQRVLEQLHTALRDATTTLRADADKYRALKEDIAAMREHLDTTKKSMHAFREVSGRIKAADFEATEFAKKIFSADQEKLSLMKEVDKLKGIISRNRRQ